MKAVGFFMLFLAISTILTSLVIYRRGNFFTIPGIHEPNVDDDMVRIVKFRKLKENREENKGHNIELEDYRPLDPVPSANASVRAGPIQHGTPFMPYIPKHAPPAPPADPPIQHGTPFMPYIPKPAPPAPPAYPPISPSP